MERIGIDALSVFGMPPVEFVGMAADIGCHYVSLGLGPVGGLPGSPEWTLRDPALRRETIAAMRDRGVIAALGEGCVFWPGKTATEYADDLDLMAELGISRINTLAIEVEKPRALDEIARLAELAAERGMATLIEFVPIFTLTNLADAIEAVEHVGRGKARIMMDCMHFARSGGTVADLKALDPDLFGYIQFCDVPLVPTDPDYSHEAMHQRRVPGEGEVPLAAILAALPRDLVVGLEIPLQAELEAGEDAAARLGRCVAATRELIAQAER